MEDKKLGEEGVFQSLRTEWAKGLRQKEHATSEGVKYGCSGCSTEDREGSIMTCGLRMAESSQELDLTHSHRLWYNFGFYPKSKGSFKGLRR